jgi:uncharacterized RDD family membrane protein YckC
MTQPPALPPEGWYPNPENTEQQRWWDGKQWTEHVAVGAPMAPGYQQQPAQPYQPTFQPTQPTQPTQQQPTQQQPIQPSQPYQPTQQPYQYQPTEQPAQPSQQYQPYQPTQQPYQPYQAAPPAQPGYQPYPGQPGGAGYPQYAGYPPAPPRGVLPDGALVAGWWWRVLARVIDGFVTGIPTLLFAVPIFTRFIDRFRDYIDEVDAANRAGTPVPDFNMGSFTRDFVILALILGLVTIVYEIVMLKLCSATVGKLACGLRVRAWDTRGPLSWNLIGKRVLMFQVLSAVPQVGGFYYLIDVLWPLWDGKKQALHDKVADSAVVKKHDAELAPQPYGGAAGFGSYQPL